MQNTVFRRREQKYLLAESQRQALEQLLLQQMEPDKYRRSTVCNIYYDTPDRRMIRRSLEKPIYKEKIRLRSYGPARVDSPVFLELKKKYKGIVYKRRIRLPLGEAMAYMAEPAARLDAGQIGREIDYVKDFYRNLEPAVYLSYQRLAWRSREGDLRITLDWDVRYRLDRMDLSLPPDGKPLLAPGQYLLEVKTAMAMPLWLTGFLSSNGIRKISFSKYGHVHMEQLQTQKRGLYYA